MKGKFNALLGRLDEWLWPKSWPEYVRVCMTCLLVGQCAFCILFAAIVVASLFI